MTASRRHLPIDRDATAALPRFTDPMLATLRRLALAGPQAPQQVCRDWLNLHLPANVAAGVLQSLPRVEIDADTGLVAMQAPFWLQRPWIVLDLETTGMRPGPARIIEVAAYCLDAGGVTDRFVTLVRPNRLIPRQVQHLTGISQTMADAAPSWREVGPALQAFLGETAWMAHNVGFDARFLEAGFAALDLPMPPGVRICTLRWARKAIPGGRHGLAVLSRRLGVSAVPAHRAEADVAATYRVALALAHLLPATVRDWPQFVHWLRRRKSRESRRKGS